MPTPPRFKPTKKLISDAWRRLTSGGASDEALVALNAVSKLADAVEMQNEINKSRDIKAIKRQGGCLVAFIPESYWSEFPPEVVDAARNCEAAMDRFHDEVAEYDANQVNQWLSQSGEA